MIPEVDIRQAQSGDVDGLIPLLKELFSIEEDSTSTPVLEFYRNQGKDDHETQLSA